MSKTERPQGIPLPAKAPLGGAVVPQLLQLDSDLDTLRTVLTRKQVMPAIKGEKDNDEELARRRRAIRPRWDAVDQPASRDQIATQLTLLIDGFLNTARAELERFARVFADDIASLKPTPYELMVACRAVRSNCEFLSIAAVVKQIKLAQRAARKKRYLVTGSFAKDGRPLSEPADYFALLEIYDEEGGDE